MGRLRNRTPGLRRLGCSHSQQLIIMDNLTLPTQLVNSILQYLGSRPFVEVAGLIQAIQQEAAKQGAQPEQAPGLTD